MMLFLYKLWEIWYSFSFINMIILNFFIHIKILAICITYTINIINIIFLNWIIYWIWSFIFYTIIINRILWIVFSIFIIFKKLINNFFQIFSTKLLIKIYFNRYFLFYVYLSKHMIFMFRYRWSVIVWIINWI